MTDASLQPRLERFLANVRRARTRRSDSVRWICELLQQLDQDLSEVEGELTALMERFRTPGRWAHRPPLPYWRQRGAQTPIGPTGIEWRATNERGRSVRTRQPTASALAPYCQANFRPIIEADFRAIQRVNSFYQKLRDAWKVIFTPYSAAAVTDAQANRAFMAGGELPWSSRRSEMVRFIAGGVQLNLRRVEEMDAELDTLMQQFHNELWPYPGSRRRVRLICRWEIDGRSTERYTGPRGPNFFSRTQVAEGVSIRRVSLSGRARGAPVSERLLQRMRYHVPDARKKSVATAARIAEIKTQREPLVGEFKRLGKSLARLSEQSYETTVGWD